MTDRFKIEKLMCHADRCRRVGKYHVIEAEVAVVRLTTGSLCLPHAQSTMAVMEAQNILGIVDFDATRDAVLADD